MMVSIAMVVDAQEVLVSTEYVQVTIPGDNGIGGCRGGGDLNFIVTARHRCRHEHRSNERD